MKTPPPNEDLPQFLALHFAPDSRIGFAMRKIVDKQWPGGRLLVLSTFQGPLGREPVVGASVAHPFGVTGGVQG
jgi:hypothetical protein